MLGFTFFDEIPDTLTVAGCTVIVLSGIAAIRLERRTRRSKPLADVRDA
ncbi:MAG: hypothetical protein AAFP84_05405 [Actinomycetota bacterium]